MTSFLKSRYKPIFIAALALLVILLLLQAVISNIIYKSAPAILDHLSETLGYRITLEKVSFSFLRGLHIKGASLFYNRQQKPIFIKDAFIYLEILPLFLKRLPIKANINEAILLIGKEKEGINLQIIFSDIYKKIPGLKPLIPPRFESSVSIAIREAKLIYISNALLKENMFILLKNSKIHQRLKTLDFSTNLEFNFRLPQNAYTLKEKIKYSMHGHVKGNDLYMDFILLNIGEHEIIGTGLNKGFRERNPYLHINFINGILSLESIATLKENFDIGGNAILSLSLKGPMDNTKIGITGKLANVNFRYPTEDEFFNVKGLNGEIEFANKLVRLKKACLELNNMPINVELLANFTDKAEITSRLFWLEDFFISNNLPLEKLEVIMNGKIGETLSGDLKINTLYIRERLNQYMQAYFHNIDFDFKNPGEKYFTSDVIELIKDNKYKIQKLNFNDLKAKIYSNKNRVEINEINSSGYDGSLNANLSLDASKKASLNFSLDGRGLDIKTLMEDMNMSDKLLSGHMDFQVMFDNRQKEFLKGNCYLKNGLVDLEVFSSIVELPSLKNTRFEKMFTHFSFTKHLIKVNELELLNPEIMIGASWNTNDKIDGLLNLSIATKLLKQSPVFRRLIKLSRLKKDYIDFAFLLGGSPDNTRIMWKKGEFKEKLKQNLPDWIKRKIEKEIDKIIDNLAR